MSTFDDKVFDVLKVADIDPYTAGDAINISDDNVVSVVFDNSTIQKNSSGKLYSPLLENIKMITQSDSRGEIYINYSNNVLVMNIFSKIDYNTTATIKFATDVKNLLGNNKPYYVQSMGYNHTITSVASDVYTFTAGESTGTIDFSDTSGITFTIPYEDTSYNHNFVAYYKI